MIPTMRWHARHTHAPKQHSTLSCPGPSGPAPLAATETMTTSLGGAQTGTSGPVLARAQHARAVTPNMRSRSKHAHSLHMEVRMSCTRTRGRAHAYHIVH